MTVGIMIAFIYLLVGIVIFIFASHIGRFFYDMFSEINRGFSESFGSNFFTRHFFKLPSKRYAVRFFRIFGITWACLSLFGFLLMIRVIVGLHSGKHIAGSLILIMAIYINMISAKTV